MTDLISISDTESFRPRFDGVAKDSDRLMQHVVELVHQDRLREVAGKSLYDLYLDTANLKLIDAYFERQLYKELERFWTRPSVGFQPPDENELAGWERLAAEGQGARAIRLWRYHLADLKPTFWFHVKERNRGSYESSPYDRTPAALQINAYKNIIARLPQLKGELLSMFDDARDFFIRAGATQAQLDQLAEERAEIEAEKRRVPGKADPRQMDDDIFWEIIGAAGEAGAAQQIDDIVRRLAKFKATSIKTFDTILNDQSARAYRNDIWALAYLLQDGCSDDAFEGFRYWLILQGRALFEAVLETPDAFDISKFSNESEACLALWEVPLHAYEIRTGKAMKRKTYQPPHLVGPDLAEEDFAKTLPRVASALDIL